MKKTESTKVTNVFNELHSKEFGKVRVVSNEKDGEGYVSADDLCRILELSEKEVFPKLSNHLYTVILEGASDKQQKMPFVDENGLYMMFLLSKKKDAIRFQEWLHGEFLQALYDQRKALAGLKKDVKLVAGPDLQRQALRYMATAANVMKSGHFKAGKAIPELTRSHLIGWWHNLNDQSIFMLQFNCKTQCYLYENIRMNVYLRKMVDGRIGYCDMHISFLDLDDDNHEFFVIDTVMPSSVISDGTILDFILEDQFIDEDIMDPENLDLVLILNGTMSFHRSRRIENNNDQPLIEFV
jgi:prophage antirepressor-like protein